MKGLLVRVGADQSAGGGHFNGPVNSETGEFVYVAIPETLGNLPGLSRPYTLVMPHLARFGRALPADFIHPDMHLDPDFDHLTYGDQGGDNKSRGMQIMNKLGPGDLLVFYAGLRDVRPAAHLVYALIGLYVIDSIVLATAVPQAQWNENAHTRRNPGVGDVVVRATPGNSGRLEHCIPIGSFRKPAGRPEKRACYRVEPDILAAWGGLSVADGFLQRSARLPEFSDADRFYDWFQQKRVPLVKRNN